MIALDDILERESNVQKASDLSQSTTLSFFLDKEQKKKRLKIMKIISRVLSRGILALFVIVISLEAVSNEEPPQEKGPEQTTEEEVTDKILPPEPEPIDEFYNYEEPLDEFGNYKPQIMYDWKRVKEAYDVKDLKFLRYLCTKVHELAGWGKVKVTNNFILDHSSISYKNPAYFPTDTEFLQYVIELPKDGNRKEDHFYLTEGLKEDCVFYLIPTSRELNSFGLGHHVCGIHRALRGTKNITDPAVGATR